MIQRLAVFAFFWLFAAAWDREKGLPPAKMMEVVLEPMWKKHMKGKTLMKKKQFVSLMGEINPGGKVTDEEWVGICSAFNADPYKGITKDQLVTVFTREESSAGMPGMPGMPGTEQVDSSEEKSKDDIEDEEEELKERKEKEEKRERNNKKKTPEL
eukprot:gnl/MRDRNA2_/MRDRNA2_70967_c0_seq2.p1 gnl/MRDRNA2_/MRDRNA2_70967_c0~~gnl/MRDRNA2_/MRDRNA2_70967_c0_seq2.p1  ORF type:complete len:156 (+),score=43.09 gnl/MRDRNA2_/MRDRNA2_70967_c0_seq2:91-558(+)